MNEQKAEEILESIEELKKFDSSKYDRKDYIFEIKKEAEPLINKISGIGEEALEYLYPLLDDPSTWTSLLALEIIIKLKSDKPLNFLIGFIKKYDKTDFWDRCELAMQALANIGKPAAELLLSEVKKDFENKTFNTYLVGALAEIKDESAYSFMVKIIEDYISDYKKYDNWFDIISFILDFDRQENKGAIILLEKLLNMHHLSTEEKIEIEDTLKAIKDPEAYKKETDKTISEYAGKFKDFKEFGDILGNKNPKIDKEDFLERSQTPDDEFELNFKCNDCKERQNLKTGLIWSIENRYFLFENELMCRNCLGHNLKISDFGKREIMGKQFRILMGKDKGVLNTGKKVYAEEKSMDFKKARDYLLKRINEEPMNGELCLRFANHLEKNNDYEKAVEYYYRSLVLNPRLIASYLNLVEIFSYRYSYYGIEGASKRALEYFQKMLVLFNSHEYDTCTILNQESVLGFIAEKSKEFGIKIKFKKIGRNEPCPCGSGKKYKKCCLGKEE